MIMLSSGKMITPNVKTMLSFRQMIMSVLSSMEMITPKIKENDLILLVDNT